MTLIKLINKLKNGALKVDEFYNLLNLSNTSYEDPELEFELLVSNGLPLEIIQDKVYLKTAVTPLEDQGFCILDIETIGHNAKSGQIIEIGAIKYKNGAVQDTFDQLIYADNVPQKITNVTGITDKMLQDKPPLNQVLEELKLFLEDDVIVAHNIKFDYGFISDSFEKYFLGKLHNRKLCTIDLCRNIYQTNRYGLKYLKRALDIDVPVHHRAYSDALSTLEILKCCLRDLAKETPIHTAEALIDFSTAPRKNRRISLPEIKKIHFIGIGGIGLSALARVLNSQKHIISGSDMKDTALTAKLRSEGIKVVTPHHEDNIKKQDLVIYSAVIKDTNIEMQKAQQKGIATIPRKEALKFILKETKNYNVCGAHGKSTTTAMLSAILKDATAIIGAESKSFDSNTRVASNSQTIVFEADESDGSFLNSNPYCAVVTNAEPEHMEYYAYDEERFYNAYKEFLNSASRRVINAEDAFLKTLDIEALRLYPSKDIKNIEFFIKEDQPYTRFELLDYGIFEVWGFGHHIATDASLAILAALEELDIEHIRINLLDYKGIKKRFDILFSSEDSILIDDYAHHPTEIKASLESVQLYNKLTDPKKIIAIWQPHKYSRTVDNLEGFKTCFRGVDELVILPVWAAGEEEMQIDFAHEFAEYSPVFADKIIRKDSSIELLYNDQVSKTYEHEMIIGFGAGDITYQLRG